MSVPSAADIETGVSNGDVDWLFRGKSKKLTKKLAPDHRLSVCSESKDSRRSSAEKDRDDRAKDADSKDSKFEVPGASNGPATSKPLPSMPQPPAVAIPKTPASNVTTKSQGPRSPAPKSPTSKSPTRPSEPNSVAEDSTASDTGLKFRFARSRSTSAPQIPDSDQLNSSASTKRRSSVNFIPGSSGASPAPADQADAATSQPSSANVSRSSSGRGKSFFSSLSSKFKSSSLSSQSTSASANGSHGSPNLSPATSIPHKLNPSLIGSGSHGHVDQDLASLVVRPPAEGGIPIAQQRKLSNSSSPKLSFEKEKGGFFKRRGLVEVLRSPSQRQVLNKNLCKNKGLLPEIQEPQLRRVAFALDKLDDDPQQQIPSRRPRKGNVLIPEDLTAPIPRLAQGISSSDGRTMPSDSKYTEKELQLAIEAQKRALLEAEKHAMEAHLSAKKLAVQISQYKATGKNCVPDEDEVMDGVENIEIDKPLHLHENHFQETEDPAEFNAKDATLEMIYTRCCHLREILPIPATLKQLKNKTRPLQVLKLLNPKPTLIDVLSFSDFIAITPINTIIFDNVTMSTEMLKHLLSALVHNKHLEKLSLRNVPIDSTGWLYLCEFLNRNHTVKKLDISQQKVKQVTKHTSFRSAMNWDLFIKALVARNGIEELVMGGCKLSDDTFENLLENALSISTCRLGMAATEINVEKCEMVADWISRTDSKCVGLDIAYNDLSHGQLRPFIKVFNTKTVNLIFFSLNSTNLTDVDEVYELFRGLSNVKTLKFLDLSSLPQLFPSVISKLNKTLPSFYCLKRIHFDLNELSSESIEALSDILPKINGLVHVSLLGNRNLDRRSIAAIYSAVKLSAIFTVDLDYDLVPDELSQRLALYLMRNMDRTIRPDINNFSGETEQDDVMFDGTLLMERAEKMLMESDKNSGETDFKLQMIITNALLEKTNAIRKDIHKIIDNLFERRNQGNLSFEGKENLLRFCLLDAALEKVVHLFEQKAEMFSTPLSPSPSVQTPLNAAQVGDHDLLHESSSALLDAGPILMAKNSRPSLHAETFQGVDQTFQPHSVVVEAKSDGSKIPVDNLTGHPVLMRSISQTSVHAKEQELEEGEFHRWGYFMEHRNNDSDGIQDNTPQALPLPALPSGSELREAIIDAKGIDSVTQLISKINTNRVSLDKIYNIDGLDAKQSPRIDGEQKTDQSANDGEVFGDASERIPGDGEDLGSIDSEEEHTVHPVVDEAYDKLLNEAERVRSYK